MRLYPSRLGLAGDDIALFGQMWSDMARSSARSRAVGKALEKNEDRHKAYQAWQRTHKLKSLDDYLHDKSYFSSNFDESEGEQRGPLKALAMWRTAVMMDLGRRSEGVGEDDEETLSMRAALSSSTEMLRLCAWDLKEFARKQKECHGYMNFQGFSERCDTKGTYTNVFSLVLGCQFKSKIPFIQQHIDRLRSMVEWMSLSYSAGQPDPDDPDSDDSSWSVLCAQDIDQFSKLKVFILPEPPFVGNDDEVFAQAEMEAKLQLVGRFKELKENNELGKIQLRRMKKMKGAAETRRQERQKRASRRAA
ncbi:hypothetical protein B9479_008181 [Cryptococcus floricola]|uniref:Uncharacterized protein n=1 Tax=Cryptococcus floricola TaxID=2591691 RepID=A0A5D3ALK4_9TREE|nr:hypothetical protein B9479_008181 [Cryptococcus floricola]